MLCRVTVFTILAQQWTCWGSETVVGAALPPEGDIASAPPGWSGLHCRIVLMQHHALLHHYVQP